MSRIGKKPIELPTGVTLAMDGKLITVSGKNGVLELTLHPAVNVKRIEDGGKTFFEVTVENPDDKKQRSLWGLFGRLIANMIQGVQGAYTKQLEMIGVGYKASVAGDTLTLEVGFSHQVKFQMPKGILAKVEKNIITLQGIDKYLIGETAAQIRRVRKPEPYKGKGIRYVGEVVRKKAGKAATKTAA